MNYIIPIITAVFAMWLFYRNNSVYEFRITVIDAMYNSKHWGELAEEFDHISYDKMTFSFKPLRIEKWYSEDFCKKIQEKR